jgi:hypothetical protein
VAKSPFFDAGVDPRLARAIDESSRTYKKHKVGFRSGRSARPKNPNSLHPEGKAMDVWLEDLATGQQLPGIGSDPNAAQAYQGYANHLYQWALQNDPELAQQLHWGGYFKGSGWPQDYMHFQMGGNKPLGGDWQGGFSPEVMQKLGLQSSGGLGAAAQQMQAAGYSPEQIRNALASIESAGSGDYKALGPWTDESMADRDRAYGRYQVMGKNIGPWGEQYLKQSGITPEMFMADPALQDKMVDAVMGDYVKQHGYRGASSKWFTGSPNEPDRSDTFGKYTGKSYADRFMAALEQNADSPSEGGSRFGGTGLGTPATGGATTPTAKDNKFSPQKMGEAMASGEGMGDIKGTTVPDLPRAALFQGQPTTVGAPEEVELRRKKLAEIMARLNTGKLTV